jgi:hypothetical protein
MHYAIEDNTVSAFFNDLNYREFCRSAFSKKVIETDTPGWRNLQIKALL